MHKWDNIFFILLLLLLAAGMDTNLFCYYSTFGEKGRTVLKRWSLVLYGTEVDVNANYNGSGGTSKGSNKGGEISPISFLNGQQQLQEGQQQQHGFSTYVLYTPRNSSSINKSGLSELVHQNLDGGGKGDPGSSIGSGGGGGGKNKGSRQRQKGKFISKKQKGATSATPTVRPVPSESHVIITSDDEEFKQFLQSKFGLVRLNSHSVVIGRSGVDGEVSGNSSNSSSAMNTPHTLVPIIRLGKEEPKKGEAATSTVALLTRASSQQQGQEERSTILLSTTLSPLIVTMSNSSSNDKSTSLEIHPTSIPPQPSISSIESLTGRKNSSVNSIVERTDSGVELGRNPQFPTNGVFNNATINPSLPASTDSSVPSSTSSQSNNQTQTSQGSYAFCTA